MRLKPKHRTCWALLAVFLCAFPLRAQNSTPTFTQQLFHKVNFNPAAIRPDPVVDVSLLGRM